ASNNTGPPDNPALPTSCILALRHTQHSWTPLVVVSLQACVPATAAATEQPRAQGVALALQFIGGNMQTVPEAEKRAPGEINYLRGGDPAHWQTHLPSYEQVVYREVWPGVDVRLRGQGPSAG